MGGRMVEGGGRGGRGGRGGWAKDSLSLCRNFSWASRMADWDWRSADWVCWMPSSVSVRIDQFWGVTKRREIMSLIIAISNGGT